MFLPPGIVPPIAQFMSPRLKSPPKNILAFLYLLSLGVLIMVRPDIKSDECPDLDTECEIKWIEIRPNDKDQILIGSFYRPPDSDVTLS
jgi:hypothetical protein